MPPEQKALYLGDWKLLFNTETRGRRLYNVSQDVGEERDLSVEFGEKLDEMNRLLEDQLAENASLGKEVSVKSISLTPSQRERLEALGYIE